MLHSTQHSSFQWEALFSVLVLYDLQIHMSIILMYNGPEEFYSSEAENIFPQPKRAFGNG